MKITKDIINDLLPLYFSNECSKDSKKLVEEYFKTNPAIAEKFKKVSKDLLADSLPLDLKPAAEMQSLKKIRRLLLWRSFIMGFAIFFSLIPLSFAYVKGELYLFVHEAPLSAIIYGSIGLTFWITYFILRKKSNDI